MADVLRTVADITLEDGAYRLAGNGRYCLCEPQDPDPFGVVAHTEVELKELSAKQIYALVQLLGASMEKCSRLEAALNKKEE